jgi:transposase
MIDRKLYARIRRLYFAEHWKVGTIAAELGVHHATVERAIESERFGANVGEVRPSILDPYKKLIGEILEKHPRLRATRIHEMVAARGYPGSAVQVRRYVAKIRPRAKAEAFFRLTTLAGEQAQVDWGHFGKIDIGAARRTLSCFVMVLSWSRAMYARFALDQTLESFLRGHVEAFVALGGVPRQILYDNLKSVVLEREGQHVVFHPRILEAAGHYHFAPQPCAPYRGNEKGKVERSIQYLRHAFFAAREFDDVADLNRQLTEWIDRVAHARPVPGDSERKRVGDALDLEREHLLPLPQNPLSTERLEVLRSGKQPYLRFDLNDYSIPHTLIRAPLQLLASETRVRIADAAGDIVADHPRSYDRRQVIEDPKHLEALGREKRAARELRGRDRLRHLAPSVDGLLTELARRGERISGHVTWLLRLGDRYGAAELEAAVTEALERGAVAAASVAHILDARARQRREPPPVDVVLPDDPRIRDLRVTPHNLDDYDRLASDQDDPDDNPR